VLPQRIYFQISAARFMKKGENVLALFEQDSFVLTPGNRSALCRGTFMCVLFTGVARSIDKACFLTLTQ